MSYAEPVSPTESSVSSPSSPTEDLAEEPSRQTWTSSIANALGGAGNMFGGAGKRRAAGGPSARDAKTRRRDEGGSRRQMPTGWPGEGKQKGDKEELLDVQLAEKLKKDFGDPFDDTMFKSGN